MKRIGEEQKMTTMQVADALGVSTRTVRRHAADMGKTENGKQTFYDEKDVTIIKNRIERSGRTDLDNVVQLPKTKLEKQYIKIIHKNYRQKHFTVI
jgi:transcriptional antiterminator